MYKAELEKIDLSTLKELYIIENTKLQSGLLDGISWEELKAQRAIVITIGSVIDTKQQISRDNKVY
jgi:hypothetical protein